MDPLMEVLMAKWLVATVLIFAGLEVQEWMAERTRARSHNPF